MCWISLQLDERDDEPGTVVGYAIDITNLRLAESRLQQLIDNSGQVIVIKDLQGRMLFANNAALGVVGKSSDEIIGFRFDEVTEVVSDAATHDSLVVERGESIVFDEESRDAEGNDRHFMAVKFPLRDEDQKIYAVGTIATDVTDRKHLEDKLVLARAAADSARAAADQANRAKSEFLSRMSHELRTPLNSILGFAQLLELDNLTPDQADSTKHINRAGRHLLNLINEVLDISRIEAGELNLSVEPVQINEVMSSALDLLRPLADQRDVTIAWDDTTESAWDPRRLHTLEVRMEHGIKTWFPEAVSA